jgi:23S rRNA pseudouridine955/2504/2580 synthase
MINFKELIEFEDDDFIIINKPYNVSTLEDRDKTKQSILQIAKSYSDDAQVCHRLDKETSGILAIAKNPTAYRHLSMQFENREVVKIYHAVVCGNQKLENQMVELPILTMKDGIVKIDRTGKEAATIFNTLEHYGKYSLVACFPITGRMHQIRIHLSSIKLPIIADKQYGGQDIFLSSLKKKFNLKKDTEELPLIRRVALHAYALTFKDLSGKEITIKANYPKDIAVLVKKLGENK